MHIHRNNVCALSSARVLTSRQNWTRLAETAHSGWPRAAPRSAMCLEHVRSHRGPGTGIFTRVAVGLLLWLEGRGVRQIPRQIPA